MIRRAILAGALALRALAQPEDGSALLKDAAEAFERRDFRRAETGFEAGLTKAKERGQPDGEARALRGLGQVYNAQGQFTKARVNLERALALLGQGAAGRLERARTQNDLAYTEWATGAPAAAARLYEEALAVFRTSGDRGETAKLLYNLAFMTPPGQPRLARIEEAYAQAREVGNTRLAGKAMHLWGDTLYTLGNLRESLEKLNKALPLLSAPGDRGDHARVLISLGRLHATHLRHQAALPYFERAVAIHREMGEKAALVQALNSVVAVRRDLGEYAKAAVLSGEAVRLARETASRSLVSGTLTNHARLLLARGQNRAAAAMLEEAARTHPEGAGREQLYLADAQLRLGLAEEARRSAATALERARQRNDVSMTASALYRRARALQAEGKGAEAVADARAALSLTEKLRAQTGPTDFLKRGYGERWGDLIGFAVELYFAQGMVEDALVAAEQGRARAFLDLLASRALASRGEQPGGPVSDEPYLVSLAATAPVTLSGIQRAAERTQSTLLVYWVGEQATYVWVVSGEGVRRGVRVPLRRSRLRELVQQTASPALGTAQPLLAQARTRGEGFFAETEADRAPYRELYQLLVTPVAAYLPKAPSALTIVPHGVLHRLSFAALRSAAGRYLLEDHAVSYLPAVEAGAATTEKAEAGSGYLFIADPRTMPLGQEGRALPALPGARRESAQGARAVQGAKVNLLAGAAAQEGAVRAGLATPRVVHFATHGVLNDARPFDSFLALGRRSAMADEDGRMTVREIYDMKMRAELVVLSACRTADGAVTGDGINNLTRAFFYAGASTVVATLWDIADEPTGRLTERFYVYYAQGQPVRAALRLAQLDVLNALRRGRVRVETPLGTVVLREHPAFWAAFVALGRP